MQPSLSWPLFVLQPLGARPLLYFLVHQSIRPITDANLVVQLNREKAPERIVHARGMTAKGYFEASLTYP